MRYLIAVDIGTTSAKALAVDVAGNVLVSNQRFYPTQFGRAGEAEQNPLQIFDAVADLIRSTNTSLPELSLEGLVFSAAMHSLMAVDTLGNPMTPLLTWADTRSTQQAHSLHEHALQLTIETGTPVHPMSPLCKLLWWRQHNPKVFTEAFKFVSIKEFVVFKLTGLFLVDHSIASATGCFDVAHRIWSSKALALASIHASRLSKPVSVYARQKITAQAQGALQLPKVVPLVLGAGDGCCAQLGSGAMHEGDVAITVGTSAAVRMTSRHSVAIHHGQLFNFILDDENLVCGGATNNGTSLISWFQQLHHNAPGDLLSFVDEAVTMPPGCDGMLMLPYVLGERAPVFDAEARGAFVGVSVLHGRLHFQRALLEGICFSLKDILLSVTQSGRTVSRFVLSGGITRSVNWVQMLCDVLQRDVHWLEQPDASVMGAAKMGFQSLGWTWTAPTPALQHKEPRKELALVYERQFASYRKLYPALQEVNHSISGQR